MIRRALRAIAAGFALFASTVPLTASAASRDGGAAYRAEMDAGMRHFYGRAFARARADFAQAHERDPRDALADTFFVAASIRAGESLQALVGELEEQAAQAPTDDAAQSFAGFAELFTSLGGVDRGDRARLAFERAAALAPRAATPHVGLGILAFELHAVAESKSELLRALQLDPRDVLAREYLAQLDLVYLEEPIRAIAALIDVTNAVPGYADAYYHLGEAALAAGRYGLAADFLRRSLRLDPHGVGEGGRYARALLVRAYEKSGRVEDAARVKREGDADE